MESMILLSSKKLPELSLKSFQSGTVQERTRFSRALTESLIEFGFVIIKDSDTITPELLSDAYNLIQDFFAMPESYKRSLTYKNGGHRGYTAFGTEHAKDTAIPDLKEFWHIGQPNPPIAGQPAYYAENIWPDLPRFKEVFLHLYEVLEDMGLILLEALADRIDPDQDYLSAMAKQGNSILRLLHYPPISENVNPGAVRAAAHEDINLITLLVAADGRGLQILTREGEWLEIKTAPENVIVDAGDMLAHITGWQIPATTHRVINVGDLTKSRYSIPFFMHPRPDTVLRPLEHFCDDPGSVEIMTAKQSLEKRLKEIGLKI